MTERRVARYTLSHVGECPTKIDNRVLVAQWDCGREKYRVTVFGIDGPHGHSYMSQREFENELRWERAIEDDTAAEWLDEWSRTPEWERGLKQCQVLAAWNAASRYGWSDVYHVIDIQPTLELAVAVLPKVWWVINRRLEQRDAEGH